MVKLSLAKHEVTVKIYSGIGETPNKTVIKNGYYNHKIYASLVLSEESAFLEGDEIQVLATEAKIIVIQIENMIMKLSKLLKDDNIYSHGIDAIPEGVERELLQALIKQD